MSEYDYFGVDSDNSDAAILSGEPMCPNCHDYGCEYCDQGPRHCEEIDESMDGDFDSAMESAGWGMDEDYGYYGDE
jgi:hypothetical protein